VARANRGGECVVALRQVATRALETLGPTAAEGFRPAVVEAIRQGPARALPDPEAVVLASGIADSARPLSLALERFDAIAALPPGRAVHHTGFGAGHITADDGEIVVIDFAQSKAHKMPYAAARRTLIPIADDDLRLLKFTDPGALKKLVAEQHAEVLWRALRGLGGSADAQKLKVFLVGSGLVPAVEWTAFWRKARAAAEKDARIDCSRAFEQHYRVAEQRDAGVVDVPLPAFEMRKPIKTNLATLRKFLTQHPGAEPALAQRFGRYVTRALLDPSADIVDRARAGLYFARWFPDRIAEWTEVLKELWEQGLSVSDLSGEDDQLSLLDASHAAGVEADAILSGLDSRFASVRQRAEDLRDHLDDRGRAALVSTLLQHAPRYPGAALRRIEEDLDREMPSEERWRLFRAALALIEQSPKPSTADKVLRWLEPGDLFDALLDGTECPEAIRLQIRVLLRQWRSSDRYLFPAVDAAERLGLTDEAETVREARQKSSERLFANVGQQAEDTRLVVMTRATWQRLKNELDRLERELRTTIPRAIQKARELGDLRENAEYHAAKHKQANVSKLVRSLQLRLTRARFVDDAEVKDGVVGLGTEVVLESEQQEIVRYWILGEDEHHHGDNVISFQAPVGRALMGRAIGDEIEIGDGGDRRRYHVVSVDRRLPPTQEEAATSD
jgi:transcription elongation factor GreA